MTSAASDPEVPVYAPWNRLARRSISVSSSLVNTGFFMQQKGEQRIRREVEQRIANAFVL